MKVAILSNLFPPNSYGGAEEAAKNQADKFFVQGSEVIILTLSPLNKFCVQKVNNIKVYELPHRNIFNYFNISKHSAPARFFWHIADVFNFLLARDMAKILKQEAPDLVITHNLKGLSFLTPLKIKKLKIKNYLVVHDVSLYTPSGLIEYGKENIFEHQGFLTRIYRFFTRRLFKYPEKVFFPSAWLLNFYRSNGFFIKQEKIYQPNEAGFGACKIQPPQSPPRSGEPKSLIMEAGSPPVQKSGFLYVGQLEKHKGIMFLLDAFEKLFSSLKNEQTSTLRIIGDGSLLPEVKKRAEVNSRIIVYGRLPREKLPAFYAQAKAAIFPSLVYENAPMVIAESLFCGTPVIVSRLGGAPELIREGKNGVTFTPGDIEDLAEKMKKYLLF